MSKDITYQTIRDTNVEFMIRNPKTEEAALNAFKELYRINCISTWETEIKQKIEKVTSNGKHPEKLTTEVVNEIIKEFSAKFPDQVLDMMMESIIKFFEKDQQTD